MKTTRQEVYEAIDSERDYQQAKWGGERARTHVEFLVYMRDYIDSALHALSHEADAVAEPKALENIRKVAALAVSCMEQNGAPRRAPR